MLNSQCRASASQALDHCSGADDDVTYIRSIVTQLSAIYRIDSSRVSVHGHSNGTPPTHAHSNRLHTPASEQARRL